MDVILLQDVEKVGLRGDVVSVSRGYMRNFLGPRRLAEEATPVRVAELTKREAQRTRHEAQTFDDAQKIADTLGKAELRFDVNAGPQGTLFGSVTATNVADEIWEKHKIRVDRRKIELAEPIKRIGRYAIPIEVFTDVNVELKTLVVPEGGELPPEEELEAMEAARQAAEAEEAEAAAAQEAEVEAEVVRFEAEVEAEEAEAAESPEAPAEDAEAETVEPEAEAVAGEPDADADAESS
ncbi:MAG TPA: 50S ribosomal protein L9 [Gaiellaceae bacterium]|jgi:large subunit ribosomal protein L9|nr:50S ribosomal protein L9 [Gaiellaceae bacterium]